MGRVVVKLSGTAKSERVELLEPRTNPRPQGPPTALGVTSQTPQIDDLRNATPALGLVSDAGDCLMAALRLQADVDGAIQSMLAQTSLSPLYLELGVDSWEAELLPWEALHDARQKFLAVDKDLWPVARRVEWWQTSPVSRTPKRAKGGLAVIKVLAVIAPAKTDDHDTNAHDEWDALEKALTHLAGKSSPQVGIEFRVLVADDDVKSYIDAKGLNDVTVAILDQKDTILAEVRNYAPHVIHVYGHGVASGGGHIELADSDDIEDDQGAASISIDADDLLGEARSSLVPVWLVVLNCCKTSANPGSAWSFAHDLISEHIPLAVGMGEKVDAVDCHTFAGALYPELIDRVERALAANSGAGGAVEWAPMLRLPRHALRERTRGGLSPYDAEKTYKPWTFPGLYAYPADFTLVPPTLNSGAQAQAQTGGQAAATLRGTPGTPPAVAEAIEARSAAMS